MAIVGVDPQQVASAAQTRGPGAIGLARTLSGELAPRGLFMASDDSLYMMGENVPFDGGMATV